jgi:hypothetical protein
MVVETNGEVAPATEYAFALYMEISFTFRNGWRAARLDQTTKGSFSAAIPILLIYCLFLLMYGFLCRNRGCVVSGFCSATSE